MNTNNLDGLDLLQVISIVAALFLGFLPSIIPMRSASNKLTPYAFVMIILFGVSLVTAFFSTLAKSSSDKEDYQNLLKRTNTTLIQANENIKKSDSILNLQSTSLDNLEKLQNVALEIQNKELLLMSKSDSLQLKSEQLNKQLAEEIAIQKQITKASDTIITQLKNERDLDDRNNHLRLILCITTLRVSKNTLYDGLQVSKTNYTIILKKIEKELFKPNQTSQTIDSLIKELTKVSAEVDKTLSIYLKNLNKDIYYIIADSVTMIKAVKDFFDQTITILDNQLSNTILQKSKAFNIWFSYFNNLSVKRMLFYLDKSTISSVKQINQLITEHDEFVLKVLRNSDLKVQIENSK